MPIWIPITIAAAFCQNLRSIVQRQLKGVLGITGATYVRFAYGFPFAVLYVAVLHWGVGEPLPALTINFALAAIGGAVTQIGGTFLLLHLFSMRNFTVGTAYSKTEPVLAALFGFVVLGDRLSWGGGLSVFLGVAGVVVISLARAPLTLRSLTQSLVGRPALTGLACAALFGISSTCYRVACLALEGGSVAINAGFALAIVTAGQTFFMGLWIGCRRPAELAAVFINWRKAIWAGMAGIAASVGWFTAMSLEPVAYVRTLAQIELLFTFAASWFIFREKILPGELVGTLLIVAAILGLIYGT